jgi:Flp pilus assembly protein TadG
MSIFLIGAIGLGIDGSHLYAHRQMAQTAADAAALSAIEDIYEGTYSAGGTGFSIAAFTCSTSDTRTPCAYAAKNGFGTSASDTVAISFPGSVPGVSGLAAGFPAELVTAKVSRTVPTTLLRFLGPTSTTVSATATAAILSVISPIPIVVNHPSLSGAFHGNGGVTVTICGGPQRSIQVNSFSTTATATSGNSNSVDLTHAGPPDPGDCSGINDPGGVFGVWGAEPSPTFNITPSNAYQAEQPWIQDPLYWVTAPTPGAGWPTNPPQTTITTAGQDGCTATPCVLWSPGVYTTGIDGKGDNNLFSPGIYYVQNGGFVCDAGCNMTMATGVGSDTATATGWSAGHMMVYNTGTGLFTLTANGTINLTGAPATDAKYPSILLFQDRGSVAHVGTNKNTGHILGGGGSLTLVGTLYMTNTRATMVADATHYQRLNLQGTPGSGTLIEGEIITDVLDLGGNGGIKMNLNNASYTVNQIALVR